MSNTIQPQIAALVKLQRIDSETARLRSFLRNTPNRLNSIDQSLEEFARRVADAEVVIKELNKKYRDYEADVQMNLAKIEKSQAKLRAVKTNKEYQSSLKEIEDLELIKSKIEDEMLACLDQIETSENSLKDQKQSYSQVLDRSQHEKEAIHRDAEQWKIKLAQLEADRKTISAELGFKLLEMFNRAKAIHADGVAIVEVKNAVCQGCNLNIPPQLYNELQRCDSLKNCPNCARMIYWENHDERSEQPKRSPDWKNDPEESPNTAGQGAP
jgi:uncharacterized protein